SLTHADCVHSKQELSRVLPPACPREDHRMLRPAPPGRLAGRVVVEGVEVLVQDVAMPFGPPARQLDTRLILSTGWMHGPVCGLARRNWSALRVALDAQAERRPARGPGDATGAQPARREGCRADRRGADPASALARPGV